MAVTKSSESLATSKYSKRPFGSCVRTRRPCEVRELQTPLTSAFRFAFSRTLKPCFVSTLESFVTNPPKARRFFVSFRTAAERTRSALLTVTLRSSTEITTDDGRRLTVTLMVNPHVIAPLWAQVEKHYKHKYLSRKTAITQNHQSFCQLSTLFRIRT